MAEKYKNRYRIKSTRLQNWDYSNNGMYFVTICTHDRIHYFGKILEGEMQLSQIGKMADKYWHQIPKHFPFVILDEFVVMPDHIHGIIIIDKPIDSDGDYTNNDFGSNAGTPIETQDFASLQQTQPKNKFGPQSKNLASIIRGYKIGVTKNAKLIYPEWKWQPRYHDHIIRNHDELQRIRNYIYKNPSVWNTDNMNDE